MEDLPSRPASDPRRHFRYSSSSGSIDLPWFLHLDHEEEVVYDASESQLTVKSGTLVGLVEQLTRHDRLDAAFNETFLTTSMLSG